MFRIPYKWPIYFSSLILLSKICAEKEQIIHLPPTEIITVVRDVLKDKAHEFFKLLKTIKFKKVITVSKIADMVFFLICMMNFKRQKIILFLLL